MIIKKKGKKLYWNIVSEDDMKQMLKIAKKDYKKAVESMNISNYTKDYILNIGQRAKIVNLIKKSTDLKKAKILDLGAGYGAISMELAKTFDTTSADVNKYTLQFIKHRAKQEKLKIKIKEIENAAFGLPFKDNSYDIILMNGVLEWVASELTQDPKKIQKEVLKEVRRILKPNGLFVLAIENRIAWDWIKGKTSHIPIKYIDLVPRFLANLISLNKRGKKFKEYIYTKRGYKKLLKSTGFNHLEIFAAIPTYQKPKKIIKSSNPFVNSFIILSRK